VLSYKHGKDVCFGDWTFNIYKKCDNRLHGINKTGLNRLRIHLMGFRAESKEEALKICKDYVENYDLPLGIDFFDAEVTHRGSIVYDCFTTRVAVATKEKRSHLCGLMKIVDKSDPKNPPKTLKQLLPEDIKDLADLDFLSLRDQDEFIIKKGMFNIQSLRQREGFFNFKCSTCDDLTIHTAKGFEAKFVCLMDKFVKLEKDEVNSIQKEIDREVRNFNSTTNIKEIKKPDDSDDDDDPLTILGSDGEDNEELIEIEDEVIQNPDFEEESLEEKKERAVKESQKVEVMKGLSCLKKYYGKLLEKNKEQLDGITLIEEKYNIECDVRKK